MQVLAQDNAVDEFLRIARTWKSENATCLEILEAFVLFYRDVRIVGAELEEYDDSDMFSIESGPATVIGIPGIGDFRRVGDDCMLQTSDQRYSSIHIYRTVHAVGALPDMSEFDDDAFNMSASLYFYPTDETSWKGWPGIVEIFSPPELIKQLPTFLTDSKVVPLLKQLPAICEFYVGGAG